MAQVKAYLKHRFTSRFYIITDEFEIEIDTVLKTIKKRSVYTKSYSERIGDNNYKIISRRDLIKNVKYAEIKLDPKIQKLLNVQLKIVFEYLIF